MLMSCFEVPLLDVAHVYAHQHLVGTSSPEEAWLKGALSHKMVALAFWKLQLEATETLFAKFNLQERASSVAHTAKILELVCLDCLR